MPASPSAQGSSGIRAALVDEVIAIRDKMVGPDGSDPALSRPISLDDDAIEMCAAVYALPGQFRERGRSGTPLMWPWPWDRFQGGLSRREELLLGAAMLLAAAERMDHQARGREQRHLQSVSTVGSHCCPTPVTTV